MNPSLTYTLFFHPGEVVEIRAYGCKKQNSAWEGWASDIVYGYFDNADDFGRAAEALDRAGAGGIYFTVNPVNPDLLARAYNRLKAAEKKGTLTTDKDVLVLRWLLLDLDPIRPKGISSTDDELAAADELRRRISAFLIKELGFSAGVPGCSGNGAHMSYRLADLPNTDANKQMLSTCLKALAQQFSTDVVDVDEVVFNPARIWKLYGTTARKGDSTERRPHRQSYIEPRWLEPPEPVTEPEPENETEPDENAV